MGITFRCEHCRHEVKAPDEAGGKRGKCPYCGLSNYIPSKVGEEDLIPLAPIDEQAERERAEEMRRVLEQRRALDEERNGPPPMPLEHREDLGSEHLHHFVVNYCLDMAEGKIDRAKLHAEQLRKFGGLSFQAVEDFLTGEVDEPAMKHISQPMLERYLTQLGDLLK